MASRSTPIRCSIGHPVLFGVLLIAGLAPFASAAPPRMTPDLPEKVRQAESALAEALSTLEAAPSAAGLLRADAAMATIERAIDAYFHAPNLRATRPVVLALRPLIHSLMATERVIVVDDVVHFHPRVHARLAEARTRLADHRGALTHRLAILPTEPSPEHLKAALEAAEAAGDAVAAAALRGRLSGQDQPPHVDQKP